MKRTPQKSTRRKIALRWSRDRELQGQLAKGREFVKKYAATFRALAK
jgi:hypothetical protein